MLEFNIHLIKLSPHLLTTPSPTFSTPLSSPHPPLSSIQDQAAVKQPIEGVGVAGGVDASTILLRLVIHDSQCHWLIGKRGSKIKKIQEVRVEGCGGGRLQWCGGGRVWGVGVCHGLGM